MKIGLWIISAALISANVCNAESIKSKVMSTSDLDRVVAGASTWSKQSAFDRNGSYTITEWVRSGKGFTTRTITYTADWVGSNGYFGKPVNGRYPPVETRPSNIPAGKLPLNYRVTWSNPTFTLKPPPFALTR